MKPVVSGLVAFCVAVVAALIAGALQGGLTPALAWAALGLGALAGAAAWRSLRELPEARLPQGWLEWGMATVFALFALRAFCWLVFIEAGDIKCLSPNNLGDLSLHLTYIRYLANGTPLWPTNPIFSAEPLHYPFGVDFFNALLTAVNVPFIQGLVWVGLLGAAATGVMLWRWGGAFALAGFLFAGGIAGFQIFDTGLLADYQDKVDWKSIPLALFITQRGLLYAFPVGLALLWSWRARLLQGERGLPRWIEVLLYATLPLFHLHTFVFLSLLLGFWMLLPAFNGLPSPRREGLRIGLAAFFPATALIWFLTGGFKNHSAIHFTNGWMSEADAPLSFWFQNLGVLPVLVALLLGWLWCRRKRPKTFALAVVVVPAVLLFRAACFVMLATWEWDNNKLLVWCYLAILPALWAMLRECAPWIRAAVCLALFFSGAVSLLGGLDNTHTGHTLADRTELEQLALPLRFLPITATFACEPTYNHPLLLLGRKAVAGYEGHLSSHGIDYQARFADLETLLRGEPGWQTRARNLGVDYLFWGDREEEKYSGPQPWKTTVPVIAAGPWGTIYDLRGVRSNPAAP